ncbi:TetR/AcrR family transcriptional regulator [Chryseobacterium sp. H1D6B]|uniref:TetR/AcrR family transcriptional regulator n=1 Tax=Chryseobacterium sp. H1D6B TaxID=2940588 RepID=UPI0015CD4205|nr:TetR/AcrR family transcriptional regulator [Chryseobacterium sp. H1D6B]MDH6254044.1 TetR/AcrR family transcriptional regulator [Chryseobacterium sp. H1D6B]
MSNPAKKDQTQELIKETAKNLFFVKGKFDATTQEIADAAGVNRTLINYYFRSRDNLIQIVFDEAQKVEQDKSKIIQNSDMLFKEKISLFVESSLSTSLQYPYLETYIVSQINKGNCHQKDIEEDVLKTLYKDIETEMELGNIETMKPVQFLLNMISLLVFPSAIRPLLMENLMIDDAEFDKIISERKEIIINMLFKK